MLGWGGGEGGALRSPSLGSSTPGRTCDLTSWCASEGVCVPTEVPRAGCALCACRVGWMSTAAARMWCVKAAAGAKGGVGGPDSLFVARGGVWQSAGVMVSTACTAGEEGGGALARQVL